MSSISKLTAMANQAEYLHAFLQPVDYSPPLLGDASRYLMKTSKMKVNAAKFLYCLLLYSPNSCELEREYLAQLRTLPRPANQIIDELSALELPEVADWAHRLSECLPPLAEDATSVLPSLSDLATHYFNNVVLALWNPSGKSTPDMSSHPAPDTDRVNAIRDLLREAGKEHRKSSLKLLVQLRDLPICPVTNYRFRQSGDKKLGIVAQSGVTSQLAHIMPFTLHNKTNPHAALEMFTGRTIMAEDIKELINTPENALLLELNAHDQYDRLFWGIEAISGPDGVRYFSRPVREEHLSDLIKPGMNKELFLGTNVLNEDHLIGLPDPRLCNTMLAIMRVLHMTGAADVLDELREDDECSREGGSGMGMSDAFDNLFAVKLHEVALSRLMVE